MLSQRHCVSQVLISFSIIICLICLIITLGCLLGAPEKSVNNPVFVVGIVFAALFAVSVFVLGVVVCMTR